MKDVTNIKIIIFMKVLLIVSYFSFCNSISSATNEKILKQNNLKMELKYKRNLNKENSKINIFKEFRFQSNLSNNTINYDDKNQFVKFENKTSNITQITLKLNDTINIEGISYLKNTSSLVIQDELNMDNFHNFIIGNKTNYKTTSDLLQDSLNEHIVIYNIENAKNLKNTNLNLTNPEVSILKINVESVNKNNTIDLFNSQQIKTDNDDEDSLFIKLK